MLNKIVEKGIEIAVGAVWTTVCGAIAYEFISFNKQDKEKHQAKMNKLQAEYDAKIEENKQIANA